MSSLKNALKGIFRNFSMSFASLILVIITLFIFGGVIVLALNTNNLTKEVFKTLSITVYADGDVDQAKKDALKEEIEKIDGIGQVAFSSKNEELSSLLTMFPEENKKFINEYFGGDQNPLDDVYQVQLDDMQIDIKATASKIEKIPTVSKVKYGEPGSTSKFIDTLQLIQKGSLVIVAGLFVSSVFLISNTVKLTINARRREIAIMRLVGGTRAYITRPFLIEGLLIGIIGGGLAGVIVLLGYKYGMNIEQLLYIKGQLLPVAEVQKYVIVLTPSVGAVIGLFASGMAVQSHLKG
ncbi:MAG: permease-like cell division protein FtsX [Mycoplasmatales bacterium]